MKLQRKRGMWISTLLGIALVGTLLLPASLADTEVQADGDQETEATVVVGGRDSQVDADENREAKFAKYEDLSDGLVLDFFSWAASSDDKWILLQGADFSQRDEWLRLRTGLSDRLELRASYQSTPYRYGSGATSVLGRRSGDEFGTVYRIGDFTQQLMQDPDGNATDFYLDPVETMNDNLLVQGFTNDLLTGFGTFELDSRRRYGSVGITFDVDSNWSLELDVHQETNDGLRALGSGTYQRITDVNGDTITDYDYFFSVRGIELPAVLDYRTTRTEGALRYADADWFLDVRGGFSEFENEHRAITYDNPFWFDGVDATSGSRRGLWEQGRASFEPSNEAWDFTVSGGVNLAKNTRLTALVSLGEQSQDDVILPITTNPATIATADINRDSVIDANDDPTLAPADIAGIPSTIDGMPTLGRSLNASADTLAYNLTVTSRPTKKLDLTGRYRVYEYEGQEGISVVPARTEYVESQVKLDFKGDLILHVPLDFTREKIDLEAGYRFTPGFKLKAFARRKSYDYDQYKDTDANTSRDSGSRAVSGTDDDIFGLTAMFKKGGWLSGRATYQTGEREFDGSYAIAFSGENTEVRQYDIANRDQDAGDLHLDFMPNDAVTIGLGYSHVEDDYADTEYGLNEAESDSLSANLNYVVNGHGNFFVYFDRSEWDGDMHLRTKCSNCTGFSSWGVPNYDWFTEYNDTTTAFGAGFGFEASPEFHVDLFAHYVEGEIEQTTRNPDTPLDLNTGVGSPLEGTVANVALGVDFPTQETTQLTTELRLTWKLKRNVECGLWWRFEDFELDDFQWNKLQPYGNNFLTVDDATRYLFLDSRYTDYTANVVEVFLRAAL